MTPSRRLIPLALGALALAAAAPAAVAAPPPADPLCPGQAFAPVLLGFGDADPYALVPGGDFEAGPWVGGASVASVAGVAPGGRALGLASGATATSPATCVSRAYRWFRMFATSPDRDARLRVEVLYPTGARTEDVLRGGAADALSPRVRFDAGRLGPARTGETTTVAIRLTALRGDWTVDDVYVDPRMR